MHRQTFRNHNLLSQFSWTNLTRSVIPPFLVATVIGLTLALGGCGGTQTESQGESASSNAESTTMGTPSTADGQQQSSQTSTTESGDPKSNGQTQIVLIGANDANMERAAKVISEAGDYQVSMNSSLASADLVLFVLSATDGPLPDTKKEIEARKGEPFQHAAILLTADDLNTDKDLHQLILDDFRSTLSAYFPGGEAANWEMVGSTDPELSAKLQAFLDMPSKKLQIK